MKTVEEIRTEITEIDWLIESRIEDYKKGIITEKVLNADKIRLTSAKNTLLWVIG